MMFQAYHLKYITRDCPGCDAARTIDGVSYCGKASTVKMMQWTGRQGVCKLIAHPETGNSTAEALEEFCVERGIPIEARFIEPPPGLPEEPPFLRELRIFVERRKRNGWRV